MHKELGKVDSVRMYREDHGILTLYVGITFGCGTQSFGQVFLDAFDKKKDRRVGTAAGMDFVIRVLDLFGVDELQRIVGRTVYALRSGESGPIIGLELPAFDGGRVFLLEDWRKEWFGND